MSDLILPGNATPAQVLSGETFSAGTNYNAAGTMPNQGSPTITPSSAGNTLAAGYYSGGTVKPGTQMASGTTMSSTTTKTFNGSAEYYVTVSGLTFTPTRILLRVPSGSPNITTIYDSSQSFVGTGNYTVMNLNSGGAYEFPTDGTTLYVTSTGFQLPINISGGTVYWYAYA